MTKEIVVLGDPKGKQRPRFSRAGKFVRTYTPKETVNYENLVKLSYQDQVGDGKLFRGAVKAEICGVFPIPKSVSKKRREKMISGEIPYIKKIDSDNLAKSILDALNNIAFDDDAQVNDLHVMKMYGEQPRVEIRLQDNFKPIKALFYIDKEKQQHE